MTEVKVISGDISQVEANALITAINSAGLWFGGIDAVIKRSAGNLYHDQAARKMPLPLGRALVAYGGKHDNMRKFTNVVFVIDDLNRPLHEVIFDGLVAASAAGFNTVTLPTIRMGVMLGVVEKSREEAVNEMQKGVNDFLEKFPETLLKEITFVVFRDAQTQTLLEKAFPKD